MQELTEKLRFESLNEDNNTKPDFYTKDEVYKASLQYFHGDALAASTFQSKYALRHQVQGEDQYTELTPDDMHDRLAKEFARIEAKYPNPLSESEIRRYLDHFENIVPQGSPMFGIGNPFVNVSLSNCTVVQSPGDNMSSIMDTGKHLANLYKRRCGVGLSLDNLRPEGAVVHNASGSSTGAVSFAEHYSNITRMVGQAGRRGALMQTMNVLHPDVDRFATIKRDETKVTGSNISIMLGDEFMLAVQDDKDWICRWPIDTKDIDPLLNKGGYWKPTPLTNIPTTIHDTYYEDFMDTLYSETWISDDVDNRIVLKKVKAKELWRLINESAVSCAEPGLLFWSNYSNNLPANSYEGFKSVSTNPCGEISLSAFDSCRLLTINLKNFVENSFTTKAKFNHFLFSESVRIGQRLMDDLVDLEIEHLQRIIDMVDVEDEKWLWIQMRDAAINGRRTGLGTHGLGDALARLCLRYDGDDAIEMVDKIYQTFSHKSYLSSIEMAKERGAFPVFNWETEKDNLYIQRLPKSIQDEMKIHGRRNISLLTLAPTGSVSIVSQTSSGLEPVFSNYYIRRKKVNPSDKDACVDFIDETGEKFTHFEVYHKNVQDWFESNPKKQMEWEIIKGKTNPDVWSNEISKLLPEYFITASEIDAISRIKVQGTLTKYLDHGSSSTLNLPKGTPAKQVQAIYEAAWKEGLKGVTVYVDGSRAGILVNATKGANDLPTEIQVSLAPKRPAELPCDIHHTTVNGEKWIVLIGILDDKPYEVFGGLAENVVVPKKYTSGKIIKRKCEKANAKGRMSCYDLAIGGEDDIKDIAVAFNDGAYAWGTRILSQELRHGIPIHYIAEQLGRDVDSGFHSFSRVMARILKRYVQDGVESSDKCELCGEKLRFEGGCMSCPGCGYTGKCS